MGNEALSLSGVSHWFGGVEVLRGLSLAVAKGEFLAVVGPSGCGKTTLLNLLSGHLAPSAGTVSRAARTRTVYQQDGLFPWLTVAENVALGLRHTPERKRKLAEMLALIGLQDFAGHYPRQLSGGMRQRVELARALAGGADALLLDEPFSALDYLTRLQMRGELARLLNENPRTVVLVTHDLEEAAQLADRIVVLSARPASIRCELSVAAPRPRQPTHKEVTTIVRQALVALGLETETREEVYELSLALPAKAQCEGVL
jgi:ABC-type nitrate/sulfonate/bicarbonate transport system ATPase subunit